MTAVNEFERPGIEKLTSDFFELAISLVDRRDVNLDAASLDRLQVTFEVMSLAIETEKEIRIAREETANIFEERLFPTVIDAEAEVIDSEVPGDETEQPETDGVAEAKEAEDRAAAEAVSSLVLSETVEVEVQSKETIADENQKPEESKSRKVVDVNITPETRNVDRDELEAAFNDVVMDFKVGDELKASIFYLHPYFKDMINEDGTVTPKAKSRFALGKDILIEKGVLEHNGKIKRQSGYILVKIPEVAETDKAFLDQ